jgi:hypothetical protein
MVIMDLMDKINMMDKLCFGLAENDKVEITLK